MRLTNMNKTSLIPPPHMCSIFLIKAFINIHCINRRLDAIKATGGRNQSISAEMKGQARVQASPHTTINHRYTETLRNQPVTESSSPSPR